MWKVKNLGENIVNAVLKYTDGELKIREATNDEPWGPHGSILQEITQMTFYQEEFTPMMEMLFSRIRDNENDWHRVYKGLLVLDYIIKNGSPRAINFSRGKIYILKKVERSKYVDGDNKDQSINVNHRSTEIISLLNDEIRLKGEREKAKISARRIISTQSQHSDFLPNRDKYDQGYRGRAFRDSIKEVMSTVVDKIQTTIRTSQKDDIRDLEDEFRVSRYPDDAFNDESNKNQRITDNHEDYKYGMATDNFSDPGYENEGEKDDFGNFVGNQTPTEHNNDVMLADIFSAVPSQPQISISSKPLDLITFENNSNPVPKLEDIFLSAGSSNSQSSVTYSQVSPQTYNQFGNTGVYQNSGIINYPNQQQTMYLGLDMQKNSSYYSPSHQNQYNVPTLGNNNRPLSPRISGSSVAFDKVNPMGLSLMASNSQKQKVQISTVDDMIRDSLESFSRSSQDSKSVSTISSTKPTIPQQSFGHPTQNNNNLFDPFF